MEPRPPVSRNQLDKVGSRVRRAAEAGQPVRDEIRAVVDAFRGWHLETVTEVEALLVGLFYEQAKLPRDRMPITSRPKTIEAILAKLRRQPTSLSRMQDIAGSRIVVPNLEVQDAVLEAVEVLFDEELVQTTDNREAGDEHGYRAVHVIVRTQGRYAEIQIRTRAQDNWANFVESNDDTLVKAALQLNPRQTIEDVRRTIDLKHGVGPSDLRAWLVDLSDGLRRIDLGERGVSVPDPPWRIEAGEGQ
jgi:ppGpp synthetase/RelA/SpoT-type nucleotidyltranferase